MSLKSFFQKYLPKKYCCTFLIYNSAEDKYLHHPFLVRAFNEDQARTIAIQLFDSFYHGYEDFDRIEIEDLTKTKLSSKYGIMKNKKERM